MKSNVLMISAVVVTLLAGLLLLALAMTIPAEAEPMASGGILPPANPEVVTPTSGTLSLTVVEDLSQPLGNVTATVVAE